MEIEQITQWIITIAPSIMAIILTLVSVIDILKKFKQLKFDVRDANAMKELRAQIQQVIEENRKLKKALRETLSKMDHVYRKPEEDEYVGENTKV